MTREQTLACYHRYGGAMQYAPQALVRGARRMRASGLERYLSACERKLLEAADREDALRAQRAAVAEAAKGPKTVYRRREKVYSVNGLSPNGVKIGRPRKDADGRAA